MGPLLLHSVSYAGLWGQAYLSLDQFVDKAAHQAHTQTDHFLNIVEVEIMPRSSFEMRELETL